MKGGQYFTTMEHGVVFTRGAYGCPPSMITERRETWSADTSNHPEAEFVTEYTSNRTGNTDYIVCPYCEYEHDPDAEDYACIDDSYDCISCDRNFVFTANFSYGFSTHPTPCKDGMHKFVFSSQYYYRSAATTVRIFSCLRCDKSDYNAYSVVGTKHKTLLPWLDVYNDPNYFDPGGVLLVAQTNKPTPVLDFLRDKPRWKKGWDSKTLAVALKKHTDGEQT